MSRGWSILKRFVLIFLGLILTLLAWFFYVIQLPEPELKNLQIEEADLIKVNDSTFSYKDAWLRKNEWGLWEMYISGSPEELGVKNGILAQELIKIQEEAFVNQIEKMIPSPSYLKFLKYITSFLNKDLPDYIPEEYLREIKAVSLFASEDFKEIGSNYARILNYHAAHDIGHAMQNLHLVECTAFGVREGRSVDSSLLIGRNFDFYVGDEFAKNKIVLFVNPEKGYSFASITWGGMIGVVSGINEQGLSITLNSAKSEIPLFSKTPVSIIAREILQYASNIEEAYEIAKRHPSFVAESFMIGSSRDLDMAIIEKTPDTTILFQSETDRTILTNHFQSPALSETEINQENMAENVTSYRYERVEELLEEKTMFNVNDFAQILRDTKGKNRTDIGLGNEGAVNQLIAHHSIIFKPEQKSFWISTFPYQLGAYLAYDLDSIFRNPAFRVESRSVSENIIPADTAFLNSNFPKFLEFKEETLKLLNNEMVDVEKVIQSNPNYFYTYELLGDYMLEQGMYQESTYYYQESLKYFIPNQYEMNRIENKLEEVLSIKYP